MIFTEAFMDILAFHRKGHSMSWIAKKLGIHRDTVKKYIFQKKQPQYRKQKRRESILGPYYQIIRDWLEQLLQAYRLSFLDKKSSSTCSRPICL